jgi:hypothetical protein
VGTYQGGAILLAEDEDLLLGIPLTGTLSAVETPSLTPAPGATSPPATPAPVPTEAPTDGSPITSPPADPGDDPATPIIPIGLAALGAIGLLIWGVTHKPRGLVEQPIPPGTAVQVLPDAGTHEITQDDRQPVTAIHIAAEPGRTTIILTEEETP